MTIHGLSFNFGSPYDGLGGMYKLDENGKLVKIDESEETEQTPEEKRRAEEQETLLDKPAEGDTVEITGVADEGGTAEVKKDEAENKIDDYVKSKSDEIKEAKEDNIAGEFQAQNLEELEEEFQRFMQGDNKTIIEGVQGMIDKITSFAEKMTDFLDNKNSEDEKNAEIPNAVKEAEDTHNEDSNNNPNDGLNNTPKTPVETNDITDEEDELPVAA